MKLSDYDYNLPEERIANSPIAPRDGSRLLVVKRNGHICVNALFRDLPRFLRKGDLLVFNNSKVFRARLRGDLGGREVELFLLRPISGNTWEILLGPSRDAELNSRVTSGELVAVIQKIGSAGLCEAQMNMSVDEVFAFCEKYGDVPLPPYIKTKVSENSYQTIYAEKIGSAAAPTAGLHFTDELMNMCRKRGIGIAYVTLHVGLGTFRPIRVENVDEHEMHDEWFDVPPETRRMINETKSAGGRVIAVGTTSLRALESINDSGLTNIFIKPGYSFKTVDGLVTNFHLPKSSLMVLVSALIGVPGIRAIYNEAISRGYRFFSFGDAMIVLPN